MNAGPSPDTILRVMSVQRFSLHDGPGIRTTVFLQGCPLHCPWCSNPESQPASGGKQMTVSEIMSVVLRDRDYYSNSGGGLTISGGEPLMQPEGLVALLEEAKAAGLHTAVETSGEASPEAMLSALPLLDTVLFDIKHCDPAALKRHTGGNLGLILENLKLLSPGGKVIARIPCIPGFNLDRETMRGIFQIAIGNGIREAHLLPYHTYGMDKYAKLGLKYTWSAKSLPQEELEPYAAMGREAGLEVRIGG